MAKKLYASDDAVPRSEEKDVSLWQDRINVAKKEQEQWADDSGAKRFIKEYEGEYGIVFHTRNKKVPVPPVGEVFAYVQSDIATTYNRDPYITVNAEAGTPKGAALWEVQLNYWWRKLKTKEELEYEIIDKDLVGYAWHKVGMAVSSIGSGDQLKIESEKLYSNYLSWKDVLWNIGSKRPPVDCSWMAQRIVRPLTWIKKKYPAAKNLEGSPTPDVNQDIYKKSTYKDDVKVGVMFEIWDADKKQVLLIAENLKDRYLEKPKPWPEYQIEFPFNMYWDFAIPGKSRPMSAISPWEPQILEKMIVLASATNHVKRWNRQAFVKNGTIDDNALDKYERGDDGAIITVNGDAADIKFADFGALPTDFYMLMDRFDSIKRNVNGQPEFAQGGVTKTASRTIGELNLMEKGTKGRQDRKIDRLETHCENIARQMMANLKGNFDFDETIKISGDTPENVIAALGDAYDPATGRVTFTKEDIEGEYDVDIKAGSTLPLDRQNRQQILEMILNTLAQVVAHGPVGPFMNALIQDMLRDFDIKDLKEAYEQEQQQAQQAAQQQQAQQSVEAGKIQAETDKRAAQAQQVQVDTAISGQEAQLGPILRAKLEKMKKPTPSVNESISFGDLPPDGKVQLAAKGGLHIATPPKEPVNGTSNGNG